MQIHLLKVIFLSGCLAERMDIAKRLKEGWARSGAQNEEENKQECKILDAICF